MSLRTSSIRNFFADRIQVLAALVVLCFVSVLSLRSQSGASYPSYVLALIVLFTFPAWRDVLRINVVRWVLALLVWLSASVFWSDPFSWREAISIWTRSVLVFAFTIAVAECQLRGQMQKWMGIAMTVVGAAAASAALVNFVLNQPEDGRLNGLGQLDTHVVAALVYGVVLLFVLRSAIEIKNVPWRLFAALAIFVCVAAVYLSDSRNAWVSVLLGVVAFLFSRWCKDPRQFLSTTAAFGILLSFLVVVVYANEGLRDIILPRGDSFRPLIWSSTVERMASESWLIGAGINTPDDVVGKNVVFAHPHNMYLAIVFQGGVIALACYAALLGLTGAALLKNFEHSDTSLAIGILTLALSSHLLDGHELIDKVGDTWFLIWLPIGMSIGLVWRPHA